MTYQESTSHLRENSPTLRLALKKQSDAAKGTASFDMSSEVILIIRGVPERLLLNPGNACTLGRFDGVTRDKTEFDLTYYGAADRGVSRYHAQLLIDEGYIYVKDLGSTNGTFVDGQRLEAHKPNRLHKGQDILLGRLRIEVMFS